MRNKKFGKSRRKRKFRRKKKASDFSLVLRSLKTYPFIINADYEWSQNGNQSFANTQSIAFYMNYPGFGINSTGTPALAANREGVYGALFRNNFSTAMFEEYRVEKLVCSLYVAYTNVDFINQPNPPIPCYVSSIIDGDQIGIYANGTTQPNVIMNCMSKINYPATQRKIVRVMKNKHRGTLENGFYSTNYRDPTNQPLGINTNVPPPKRGGIAFWMPTSPLQTNGDVLGVVTLQWYVRFRGTGGTLNITT